MPEDIANQILVVSSPVLSGHVTGAQGDSVPCTCRDYGTRLRTVSSLLTGQVIMVEGGMEGRKLNERDDIDFSAVKSQVA